MFTMFTVVWSASARAPRCVVVFGFPPVYVSLAHRRFRLDDSAIFEHSEGSRSQNSQNSSAADFSSRAISVRCSLAACSPYDSNVSRPNPVWICFGRLLSPRFRDRLADDLENSQCDLTIILPPAFDELLRTTRPTIETNTDTADLSHPLKCPYF